MVIYKLCMSFQNTLYMTYNLVILTRHSLWGYKSIYMPTYTTHLIIIYILINWNICIIELAMYLHIYVFVRSYK